MTPLAMQMQCITLFSQTYLPLESASTQDTSPAGSHSTSISDCTSISTPNNQHCFRNTNRRVEERKQNSRQSRLAASHITRALALSFSRYLPSSWAANRNLLGWACISTGSRSSGPALATAPTVLKPLSQKMRLDVYISTVT